MKCRFCKSDLEIDFIDLGFAPPSNAYLTPLQLNQPEKTFPLRVKVCSKCWLVQTEDYNHADELFDSDYAYFSSTSSTFLDHARVYSDQIIELMNLNSKSFVVEIASNDGYLLRNFVEKKIPCLGIEPTKSTAEASKKLGIPNLMEFFGLELATKLKEEEKTADLIIANNVFAHVPNINDFTAGLKTILNMNGIITLEFPHLLELIKFNQFDTIYHEHFSYLSLTTVNNIFKEHDLKIFDVEKLPTHGGSLRVYVGHKNSSHRIMSSVDLILEEEKINKLTSKETYSDFQSKADKIKNSLLKFLIDSKSEGKVVVAYGAAAKGNTLLNYSGIKPDLIGYVADAAPSKQNKFMPGSHIPIVNPDSLLEESFDYLLILPWNIAEEVVTQLQDKVDTKVKFLTAIPEVRII